MWLSSRGVRSLATQFHPSQGPNPLLLFPYREQAPRRREHFLSFSGVPNKGVHWDLLLQELGHDKAAHLA